MHQMIMYGTNGVMGTLTIMGMSFQVAMQYLMVRQVQRYKRIFGDKELEAAIQAEAD
jgi:hypothetical protein